MLTEGPEKLLAEPGIERPDLLIAQRDIVLQERPVGYIGDNPDQGLVHRHMAASIAVDARLAAKRPAEGLSETDADIFDGMMIVDLDVAFGRYRQVEKAVNGKEGEHVIEERNTGIDRRLSFSVQSRIRCISVSPVFRSIVDVRAPCCSISCIRRIPCLPRIPVRFVAEDHDGAFGV